MTKVNEKIYHIWSEGFRATGEYGFANYFGSEKATSFQEACDLYALKNPEFATYYNADQLTYWGCRLFDNEADARKSFG